MDDPGKTGFSLIRESVLTTNPEHETEPKSDEVSMEIGISQKSNEKLEQERDIAAKDIEIVKQIELIQKDESIKEIESKIEELTKVNSKNIVKPGESEKKMVEPEKIEKKMAESGEIEEKMVEPLVNEEKMVEPLVNEEKMVEPEEIAKKMAEPRVSEEKMVESLENEEKMVETEESEKKMAELSKETLVDEEKRSAVESAQEETGAVVVATEDLGEDEEEEGVEKMEMEESFDADNDLDTSKGEKRGRKSVGKQTDKRTLPLETRQKSKRPRRHVSTMSGQYEYDIANIPAAPSPTNSAKKIKKVEVGAENLQQAPYYVKGEVLAVRNEDGGFYLCLCPNNIFTVSKPFKVQWLDKCREPNVFKRSYFDYLHFKSVLYSGVVLNKIENNEFMLLETQMKKINHRLEKSLRGESEISSDSDTSDDADKKMTNLKRAAKQKGSDGKTLEENNQNISITAKVAADSKGKRKMPKEVDTSRKLGKIQIHPSPKAQGKRRNKYEIGQNISITSPTKLEVKSGDSGSVVKPRGRPRKSKEIMSNQGAVHYMINPDVVQQMEPKTHKSNESLVPNQAIDISLKDPAFELRQSESYLPRDKLAIRAAILQDVDELDVLFSDLSSAAKVLCKTRSVDIDMTALHYSLLGGNTGVIRCLATTLSRLGEFQDLPSDEVPSMLKDSFDAQNGFKGEELSAIDISKGLKEGNHAFLKDSKPVFSSANALAKDIAYFACSQGLKPEILQLIIDVYPKTKDVDIKELLFENIHRALEMGNIETAQFLIRTSRHEGVSPHESTSRGLTELHELVLNLVEPLPPAFTVKDAKKKSVDMHRLQAVHCAACNPDSTCLKQLINAAKECLNTMDGKNRRPIHYAAACTSTQPLEFLINKVSIEEQDIYGMTPLMIAAESGRHRNVDLLLKTASNSRVLAIVNVIERPDRSNRSAVHYAAQNGHHMVIEILAKYKADLSKPLSVSKARATPLMLAAAQGHIETCMSLIEYGASIEIRDKLQRTALIHAAINGHYPIISYLLNKGADPNVCDSSNNSAIHYSSAYGWHHCVSLLLQASANPDVFNDRKMPPIGVALLKDHREVAQLLSDHHADANFRDDRGRTLVDKLLVEEPLSWKLVDKVTYLLESFKPEMNAQDVQGMAAIHNLASNSVRRNKKIDSEMQSVSMYLAELLLDRGAELNMADYRGRLPLYFAVEDMNVSLVELFVRRGTHCPRSTSSTGDNILHMIAKHWDQGNMADIVFGLVNMTSQTVHELASRRNKFGFTPLILLTKAISEHKSVTSGSGGESEENQRMQKQLEDNACPLMEALILAAKSDVSAVVCKTRRNYKNINDEGKSTAHYLSKAAVDKECKVFACLLRHKPRLDVLDGQGLSPLLSALLCQNCRAVQMLLDVGAQPNFCSNDVKHKYPSAPLILAVARHGPGDKSLLPAIRSLLRTISDIKQVSCDPRNKRSALMYAVEKEEELELVNALLEKQASLSEVDVDGRSSLHLAVNASGPNSALFDIPDLLIEKGASLTSADHFGRVPLHYAYTKIHEDRGAVSGDCDPIELTTLLTSGMKGSEVDCCDLKGRSPLHEAARKGAMICCMHLVERGANINRQDQDLNTPLSLAVKAGHNSCAVMLIQKGANVNSNVLVIPSTLEGDEGKEKLTKWRLKSSIVPAKKATCEPVFKVVVEKGWQGVTYVMLDRLEACGVKYASAVESAMKARKYQVVLSLLRKQRDASKLCEKNNQKQNLLHVLAINKPTNTDVQIKVAKVLIERGVPSYTTDEFGCTPLHYSAFTKNIQLIKFFIERNPSSFRTMIATRDLIGRNVFSALLWNSKISDDVTINILRIFLEHDKNSGAINQTCKFPSLPMESLIANFEPANVVEDYFNAEVEGVVASPLIRAILLKAHRVVDLLLEYNVDINLQVEGLKNQTSLMLAVKQNDVYVVGKLLTHHTPILLSSLDTDDKNVLHHAAKPLEFGYWENMTILKLILEQGVPVNQVDKSGNNALSYALQGGSGRMSDELQNIMGISRELWVKPTSITDSVEDGIVWDLGPPQFEGDAVTILDRIREDEIENDWEFPNPHPDLLSALREAGEIVFDPQVGKLCDVFLIAVDVQQSGNVQYNFFRMQVIHQKGKNLYMFFTRWGIIGDKGNWQTSPFNTPANAIKEFAKYFKLKTANEWRSVNNFKPQTRKYQLVSAEVQRRRGVADLEFDLYSDMTSCLAPEVQQSFSDMINVESMKEAMKESTNVDPDVIPFGRLEKERLALGIEILTEIKELLSSTTELKKNDPQDQIRLQRTLEKIQQRSTEYYRVLPPKGSIFDRIRPISDNTTLTKLIKQTKRLSELEFANKVLLGAQYRINEMNPLDYVYRSVGAKIQVMDPNSDESQYLLQSLHNTGGSNMNVDCIFRVNRLGESNNIVSTNLGNYKMLWSGTNILSLMSTLHEGLQPAEAQVNGNLGKGIYLFDMVARAVQDCKVWGEEKKYLLLCQVALGNVEERSNFYESGNSVKLPGKYSPDPNNQLILPGGGSISLGSKVKNDDLEGVSNYYNEYLVKNPDQVCIRYLVRFDNSEPKV